MLLLLFFYLVVGDCPTLGSKLGVYGGLTYNMNNFSQLYDKGDYVKITGNLITIYGSWKLAEQKLSSCLDLSADCKDNFDCPKNTLGFYGMYTGRCLTSGQEKKCEINGWCPSIAEIYKSNYSDLVLLWRGNSKEKGGINSLIFTTDIAWQIDGQTYGMLGPSFKLADFMNSGDNIAVKIIYANISWPDIKFDLQEVGGECSVESNNYDYITPNLRRFRFYTCDYRITLIFIPILS